VIDMLGESSLKKTNVGGVHACIGDKTITFSFILFS
jgi:hypothetical protein